MTTEMDRPFFQSYFGIPNFGDELLCRAVVGMFDIAGTGRVASRRPRFTKHTLRATGARVVLGKFPHLGFWLGLPERLWNLRKASALFVGGGGVIQDVYSPATIMSSAFDVAYAVRNNTPFGFVGIEIGEIKNARSLSRAEFMLQNAAVVWCRDDRSFKMAQTLGAGERALLAPDLSHAFLRTWPSSRVTSDSSDHCVINVRALPAEKPDEFRQLVHEACEKFENVTLASAQPGEELEWVSLLETVPSNLRIFSSGRWRETLEMLETASMLIAERFHFIAAGAHLGLRVVPILATHKASQVAVEMGIASSQSIQLSDYTHERLWGAIRSSVPVDQGLLDALAARVHGAVRTSREMMAKAVVYSDLEIGRARRISRGVLWAGSQLLAAAVRRRLARALRLT